MEFRIAEGIRRNGKKSYAIESEEQFADMEVDCGEGINTVMACEAARRAFASLDFSMAGPYPHSPALKDAICLYARARMGADLTRDNLCLTDGSIGGLYLLNRLFLEPGDRVLGYVPQFSEYETDVRMHGCVFDSVPLREENGFRFDADEFIAALRPEHKLAYLDNPNNPTGQILPLADVERILTAAAEAGVPVAVDEAYGEYMPAACSALNLWGRHDNLIVVKTFSKGFGLAGLRAGYLVLPADLARAMGNITNPYAVSAPSRHVAAAALLAELEEGESSFIGALRARTAAIKAELIEAASGWKRLKLAHTDPGVSISLITHRDPGVDLARAFALRRVLVISGGSFSGIGRNSIRLRVPAKEDMPAALAALRAVDGA